MLRDCLEAILGQKQSRNSYIAHGASLDPSFGCPCMHMHIQADFEFRLRRY